MKLNDMLTYAFKSLTHSSLRTWLTILGIIIGISSVIILVSIGQGLNVSINEQLAQFGTKTIVVIPVNLDGAQGVSFGPSTMATSGKLYMKDVGEIKKLASVDLISPIITQRASLGFKGKDITSSITGVEPDIAGQISKEVADVEAGRWLTSSDRNVVVLGNDIAQKSFGKDVVSVNSYVYIDNHQYRVIGVLKKSGSSFASTDSSVFVNFQDAQDLFASTLAKDEVSAIRLTVKDDADVELVAGEIEDKLRNLHRVREGEEDFGLITPDFINSTVGTITSLLTVFLGAIAAISLVVGGVGIMNTMFMAVVERTKEIGTLKAIGASSKEILSIFLIESGAIGMVGGVLGALFAIALLLVVKNFSVPVYIDPFVVSGAFAFSFLIGLASGFIPSWNASKVSPLEALRYE
ncbi:MAG: ABC transporter permease [Candidatus Micrarchaeia archaeon]